MPRPTVPARDPREANAVEELAFASRALLGVAKQRPLTSLEKQNFMDDCLTTLSRIGLSQPVIAAALHVASGNWPDEEAAQVREYEAAQHGPMYTA